MRWETSSESTQSSALLVDSPTSRHLLRGSEGSLSPPFVSSRGKHNVKLFQATPPDEAPVGTGVVVSGDPDSQDFNKWAEGRGASTDQINNKTGERNKTSGPWWVLRTEHATKWAKTSPVSNSIFCGWRVTSCFPRRRRTHTWRTQRQRRRQPLGAQANIPLAIIVTHCESRPSRAVFAKGTNDRP